MMPMTMPKPNDKIHTPMTTAVYTIVSSSMNSTCSRVIKQSSPFYIHVPLMDL